MSMDHEWFKKTNNKLKQNHKFKTVVGGPHFSAFPEDGIYDEDIDYVVQGAWRISYRYNSK